jgi:hypothetical protein
MPNGEYADPATSAAVTAMTQNNFISFFNSVPSLRGILQPVFGGFLWFDEIYLFLFHERDYGANMKVFFR